MSLDLLPVTALEQLIERNQPGAVAAFLHELPPEDTAYTISHLEEEQRSAMFAMLAGEDVQLAADLMEHFNDAHAADIVAELDPDVAAAIVDEMDSDEQADVLGEMDDDEAEAILTAMDPEEASDTRKRLRYDDDSAGGLMITEYLAYPEGESVEDVAEDLRENGDLYGEYEVRYVFAVDGDDRHRGIVPMRRLVMSPRGTPLRRLLLEDADAVDVDTHLDELEDIFDRVDLSALPVVDEDGRLVGVVQRAAVQEARGDAAEEDLAKVGGIVGGEELRTMPTHLRAVRRLMFLVPIMLLMMVSAGVISLFRETVENLPIIAAFLPLVAGLCGSGGNQAVAVSMREISLGLIKPSDFWRVAGKEASVALINGLVLGLSLMAIVTVWEHNLALGMVIGAAVPSTIVVAGVIGGGVPLVLRMINLDPAMASGPAVTTLVDLLAYFTTLTLATLTLGHVTH